MNREDDQLHSLAVAQPAMLVERKRKVCRKVLSHEGLRSSSALSGSIAAHRARARFPVCERARSGMPTCKLSTSPPSRELGNVEPGEAPAKPLRQTLLRLDQLELKLSQLSSVGALKPGRL